MPDNVWTVVERGGATSKVVSADKHPYVMPIRVPKDATEETKKFWDNYNSMQKMLMNHGLMESK